MTDIWNGVRTVIVIVFILAIIGIVVWGISKIQPAIESAATLEQRVSAENARQIAEAHAAPTFVALQVEATRIAIRNTETLANAQANAATIAAQGQADSARGMVDAIKTGIFALVAVALVIGAGILAWRVAVAALVVSTQRKAIDAACEHGGTIELENGRRVLFERRADPHQLGAGAPQLDGITTRNTTRREK
jgi:hypothetical protein